MSKFLFGIPARVQGWCTSGRYLCVFPLTSSDLWEFLCNCSFHKSLAVPEKFVALRSRFSCVVSSLKPVLISGSGRLATWVQWRWSLWTPVQIWRHKQKIHNGETGPFECKSEHHKYMPVASSTDFGNAVEISTENFSWFIMVTAAAN